jgi:serine/threonine protein phosphatase PrpC
LYTAVPEALLQNTILETQDVTKQAESLIDAACRHGGKDNITVVIVSL